MDNEKECGSILLMLLIVNPIGVSVSLGIFIVLVKLMSIGSIFGFVGFVGLALLNGWAWKKFINGP